MSARGAARGAARRSWQPAWAVDLAVVAVLLGAALVGLVRVFGGWWFAPAALTGLALGLLVAALGAWRRWAALTVAGATVLVYLLVGGPLAFRSTTLAGFLPTLATLHDLVLGAVQVWKGFVTAPIPVVAFPQLVAVPFLAALLTAVLAGSLALRVRRPGWALVPVSVLLVGTILLSTAQATWPVVQGGAVAVVAVGWLAWRRARAVQGGGQVDPLTQTLEDRADVGRLRRRRLVGAAGMAVVVAALVAAAGPAVAGQPGRVVLRDRVQPPLDLHDYASPLEAFRRLVKDQADAVLFTVTGLAQGERLRLAVLDDYTGEVMDVAGGDRSGSGTSGSFEIAGAALSDPSARALKGGSSADLTVEVGDYRGVWVPGVGLPTAVSFGGERASTLDSSLYVNDTTGTMVDPAGLRAGDTYTISARVPAARTLESLGSAELARAAASGEYRLEATAQAARTFVGTESHAVEQVRLIRDKLVAGGVFSDGLDGQAPSPAGHGAWRIAQLLAEERYVGDDEQFAVAAALMIRSLGYQARVVMGFVPEASTDLSAPWGVRGTDVHAWVEVQAQDAGWVPVDVTPDENQVPQQNDPRSNRAPQTTVIQDPPTPEEPALAPQPPLAQEQDADKKEAGSGLGAYLRLAAAVGVPLVVLVAPLVAVVVLKRRRRRRRLRAPDAAARVSGGWYEVTDAVVDLGASVPVGATRFETAVGLQGDYGGQRMLVVAQRADRVVFGVGEPSADEVERFWAEVDVLLGEVRSRAGWWRRLRARFSVRSLRRGRVTGRGRPRPWRKGRDAR